MRVLTVPYPLTPISESACGGTEQIAYQVVRGLGAMPGVVMETAAPPKPPRLPQSLPPAGLARLERQSNRAVIAYLRRRPPFDLIHNQGGFFYRHAAFVAQPVLMTLHLARRLYPADFADRLPPNLHLQCVSETQHREYLADTRLRGRLVPWIANGIDLGRFVPRAGATSAGAPLLFLGRICPEKAPHVAIAIAGQARRRLLIIGDIHPFPSHRLYFREHIEPHLGPDVAWMPPPAPRQKALLLASAAAVVIPSRIEETSSLVAMEAAACGVPALALRRGALAEIVVDGETGWLGDDGEQLAQAVERLHAIDPRRCRALAERRFCGRRMVAQYHELYRRLIAQSPLH